MMLNTCMKFYEHILNGFKVIELTIFDFVTETATYIVQRDVTQKVLIQEWTRFCHRNCFLQSSMGHNSQSINTRVMVLALCMSSNVD